MAVTSEEKSSPVRESEILLGFFYQVVWTWGGVILTIQTFFKAKNSFLWILNINYLLK